MSQAKMDQEKADDLRRKHAEGWTWQQLQDHFGISQTLVQGILDGSRWNVPKPKPGDAWPPIRIQAVQAAHKYNQQQLADRLGISVRQCQNILTNPQLASYRRPGNAVVKILEQLEAETKKRPRIGR